MTPIKATLIAWRRQIETPERWCQKWSARDLEGRPVEFDDTNACRWCLFGAILRVISDNITPMGHEAVLMVENRIKVSLFAWNDKPGRTHAEVMALLDACIAVAD